MLVVVNSLQKGVNCAFNQALLCRMDQLPTPILSLIPYTQVSPDQLAQALFAAREALGLSYAEIAWPQWYEAFAYFQPLLVAEPNQVRVTTEGLTAVARYFDTRYPPAVPISPLPHTSVTLPPVSEPESASGIPLPPAVSNTVKRTYSLHKNVVTSLERVSFWQRVSMSSLVNLAVEQMMATYSESKIPLPLTKV
jgi:hypothetical protein